MTKLKDEFLHYCTYYKYGKPREEPALERTIARYERGLNLVEKIIKHDLNTVTNQDQLLFIDGIKNYAQGTRRVSTQIFQRFIAWGIKNKKLDCDNLIVGKEDQIIGQRTPVSYKHISRAAVRRFFKKLNNPQHRIMFGLMYFSGLTSEELASFRKQHIGESEIFVLRNRSYDPQMIPVSERFMRELVEYAEDYDDVLFPHLENDTYRSSYLNSAFKQAQLDTGELVGMTLSDFRTSGIRHFFETCQSLELTKEYAGIPKHKRGWIDSLADTSYYIRKHAVRERGYHEQSKS